MRPRGNDAFSGSLSTKGFGHKERGDFHQLYGAEGFYLFISFAGGGKAKDEEESSLKEEEEEEEEEEPSLVQELNHAWEQKKTEMAGKIYKMFVLFVCLLTGLCQGPQPIHGIAGYKVLLQSLLPGSLHSLESTVQV